MKRVYFWFVGVVALLFACAVAYNLISASIPSNDPPLRSGNYCAVGDYKEYERPYLRLDTKHKRFVFAKNANAAKGAKVHIMGNGNYEFVDGRIVAVSGYDTFYFKIKDNDTLVYVGVSAGYFLNMARGTEFVFKEE